MTERIKKVKRTKERKGILRERGRVGKGEKRRNEERKESGRREDEQSRGGNGG